MSYCVNCGVELAPSEPRCPLCGTEVVNPANPWREPRSRPYPAYVETVLRGVDRRFFSLLAAVILLIPLTVCLLVDLFSSGGLSWSVYVVGAVLLLMVAVLLPVAQSKPRPFLCLLTDIVALLLYLLLIDIKAGGPAWFIPLALPITLSFGLISGLVLFYFWRRRQKGVLIPCALILFGAGAMTMLVELAVRGYRGGGLTPSWSWYALAPCMLSALAFLILNKRRTWKENVRKRLFF